MSKVKLSHRRFVEHGRYDKKIDSYNGLSCLSPEKQKAVAETRMRAQKLANRIFKEGIVG